MEFTRETFNTMWNFYLECSKEVRFSDRKDKIYLSIIRVVMFYKFLSRIFNITPK